jgi:hypothetical protein
MKDRAMAGQLSLSSWICGQDRRYGLAPGVPPILPLARLALEPGAALSDRRSRMRITAAPRQDGIHPMKNKPS